MSGQLPPNSDPSFWSGSKFNFGGGANLGPTALVARFGGGGALLSSHVCRCRERNVPETSDIDIQFSHVHTRFGIYISFFL